MAGHLHFPHQSQWIAVFLAFQSQAWHADDRTGDSLSGGPTQPGTDPVPIFPRPDVPPTDNVPDGLVRIVCALINAASSPEHETVTLLNTSNREIDLAGWKLADKQKNKMALTGKLAAGRTVLIPVQAPMALSNKGGIITLLDERGRQIHGVSYTKEQARQIDWTIPF